MARSTAKSNECDEIEFIDDSHYLNDDGSIPQYVENCNHQRMEPCPRGNMLMVRGCKDCGQLMVPSKGNWVEARGKIPLPVTCEKVVNQMLINIGARR